MSYETKKTEHAGRRYGNGGYWATGGGKKAIASALRTPPGCPRGSASASHPALPN